MGVRIYVTYGYGTNLRNCYSIVEDETMGGAMEQIHIVTEGRYAFTYTDEADFQRQIKQYSLREVALQPQHKVED